MVDTTEESALKAAVQATIGQVIARLRGQPITREALADAARVLEGLAQRRDLLTLQRFPVPQAPDALSARYALHQEPDDTFALYLIAQKPGRSAVPHDHKTWAVIVAVQGEELNRLYRRTDDGANPDHAQLALEREVVVAPGAFVTFLHDDIHSIHVQGQANTLHLHLYGRPLESLTERVAYDLATGQVSRYNQTQWVPNAQRA